MNNKLQTILIYLLLMWGFGLLGGYLLLKDKYDELESQYNADLNSCYTLLESCQVSSKSECYVNGGWNCE